MAKAKSSRVLKFDGQSTFVNVGPAPSLGLVNSDFTIETWVRIDDFGGRGDLAVLGNDQTGLNIGLHFVIRNRRPYMGFYQNDLAGRTELAPKTWYHIAWRYTRDTQEQAIFVNGILDAQISGRPPFQGSGDILIGRWAEKNYFNGAIAEVRIWNHARQPRTIRADMQRRLAGDEPGLTAYWRLDDNSTTAADSTQHIAHGEIRGEPRWLAIAPPFEWDIDQVLFFDGSQDRLSINPFTQFPDRELTFECWVRSGNRAKAGTLVSYANTQTDDAFVLLDGRNLTPTINQEAQPSGVAVNDGLWHHVAVTWQCNDGKTTLYKDGEKLFETTLAKGKPILNGGGLIFGQEQDVIMGGFDPAQAFKGEMAEIRLWNKARSMTNIRSLMKKRITGSEEGLVGYWPLNTPPQLVTPDLSSWRNHAISNGPLWKEPGGPLPSETNRFVSLDGVDDFIQIPSEVWFRGDFTVESWVFFRRPTFWARLFDFGNGPDADNVLVGLTHDMTGLLAVHLHSGTATGIRSNVTMPLQRWAHVAVSLQGNLLRLFLDGREVASMPGIIPPRPVTRSKNYIGRSNWRQDGFTNGMFAEVRIWNRARPQEEIAADRMRRLQGNEPGLLGCWPLDEGKQNIARNLTNPSLNGTIVGATWVKPEAAVPSQSGHVLTLDGVDDYVSVVIDVPETDATHELWFRTAEPNCGLMAVVDRDLGAGGHDRHLFLRGGNLFARIFNNETIGTSGLNLADNQWHHVAHVFGASVGGQRLYVDGKQVAAGGKAVSDFNWQKRINIGFSNDAARLYFNGQLCEVRIWNKIRTPDELLAAMYKQIPGNTPNLIGYWRLDEKEGAIAYDTSDFKRDGILSGPCWQAYDLPVPSKSNKVLALDGEDDVVYVDSIRWESNTPVTVEFWVKVNEIDVRNGVLFTLGNQDNPNRFQAHVPWGDQVLYWDYGHISGAGRAQVDFAPYIDTWTHVALVSQGGNGSFMGIYLNGRLITSTNRSDSPKVRLRGLWLGNGLQRPQKAQLAEFRIWNKMRSAAEIKADMFRRLNGTEPDLFGYWPLDGNANDGLAQRPGAITAGEWEKLDAPMQAVVDQPLTLVPAATFDGAGKFITIPAQSLAVPQTITVEAWVKPTGQATAPFQMPAVSKSGEAAGWELRAGSGRAEFMVTVNRIHYQVTADQVENGQWYHLAGVYNGQNIQLYINGVLRAAAAVSGPLTPYLGEMNIGRNPRWTDRLYAGQVADVRIWNIPRTQAEIQTFLFRRLQGNESGLVGYWKLNEGLTDNIVDSSSNKLIGTPRGVEWVPSDLPLAVISVEPEIEIDFEAELQKLRLERDDLRKQLEDALARIQSIDQDNKALNQKIEEMHTAQTQELNQRQETHRREIATLKDENAARIEAMTKEGEVALADLIRNANDQIAVAREELIKKGGNYRLGRVSMELKMLPAASGTAMIFPKPEEMGKISELSSINLDFAPQEAVEEAAAPVAEVPNVLGYTELLAQRKLSEAGFGMEINYQAITIEEGRPSLEDRVVNQIPGPKERAKPFSTVTLFIGKKS